MSSKSRTQPKTDGDEPKAFILKGQVWHSDGSVFADALVRAFDKDLRSEEQLGEALTDQEGRYLIRYTSAQFRRTEQGSADLLVRAVSRDGKVLAASPVIFNAAPEETIDLMLDGPVGPQRSEYERLLTHVMSGLPGQGLSLAELTEEDISFLSGKTGSDALRIAYLSLSARRSAKTKIPAEAFYGLFRQNLPTHPGALLLQKPDALRHALEASVQQNIIPSSIGPRIESIVETLAQPSNLSQLDEPDAIPALRLLGATTLPREKQAKFVSLAARHDGTIKDFWQGLRQDPDFGEESVRQLKLTLQLGLFTGNHPPLIRELQKRESLKSIRDLAGMEQSDWLSIVGSSGVGVPDGVTGESQEEKHKNYVAAILQLTESAFPTATVAAKLIKENRPGNEDAIKFFSDHPDFDFANTRIDDYLTTHEQTALSAARDGQGLVQHLKGLQRAFQVAPKYEHMQALMDEGLDSAHAITTLSEAAFVDQFGASLGGETQAKAYYARARHVSETSASVVTNLVQAVGNALPAVIAKPPQTVKQMPNFSTLFGAFNLCECEHCQSVYSPAAYLVDLFQFLNPRAGEKPLDSLRTRRPDLTHIQLSCDNTETPLPYIDLVNEILEYYIAHNGQLEAGLSKDTVNTSAEELSVNPQYRNDKAYEILRDAVYPPSLPFNRPLTVARAYLEHLGSSRYELMQTFQKANDAPPQLAIDAEYLKITAEEYAILTGKDFAGNDLPQQTNLAEFYGYDSFVYPQLREGATGTAVRALQRLLNAVGTNPPLPVSGAFDTQTRYAVNAFKQTLGLQPNGIADQRTWDALRDIHPNLWLSFVAQVPEFLQHTGIGYSDLNDLLNTYFINPDKAAPNAITVSGSGCDTSAMFMEHVDGTELDNADLRTMHRFIRLWRKLGWTMADLDRAFIALNKDDITPEFLQTLAEVARLQALLNLPLDQLLSFWSDVDADGRDSLYIKLFQNTAVLNPVDDDFRLVYEVQLDNLPSLAPPLDSVTDKISYDAARRQLNFVGSMTSEERRSLLSLSSDTYYENAIEQLFQMQLSKGIDLVQNQSDGKISDHLSVILAALRISMSDLELIRTDAGLGDDTEANPSVFAALDLANLSTLYRYSVLTRVLKLKVSDLIAFKALSGINPFESPARCKDFVDAVGQMRQSGFSVAQLNYLYRHLSEPPSNFALQPTTLFLLAKTLHDGLAQIAADNSIVDDPNGELTQTKLALIFDGALVDQLVRMIQGSAIYTTPLASLPAGINLSEPVKNKVSYHAGLLQFAGPMTTSEQHDLLNASVDGDYQAAVDSLFQQPRTLVSNLLPILHQPNQPDDEVEKLLETASINADGTPNAQIIADKFQYVLERLLPYLRDKLSSSLVKQTISNTLNLDGTMVDLLLETPTILPSQIYPDRTIAADFLALQTQGLTGSYFSANDLTGVPTLRIDETLAFDGNVTALETNIPAGTGSIRWTGMLMVPSSDTYTLYVRTGGGVRLWLGGEPQPIIDVQQNQSTTELSGVAVTLKPNQLYDVRLELTGLSDHPIAELRWSSPTTSKEIISSANLYPTTEHSFTLLQKVSTLVNGFKLNADEVAYLTSHAPDFADLSFAGLALEHSDTTDQQAPYLFQQWHRLNNFITLRNALPQGDVSLIDVFSAMSLDDAMQQLTLATGWDVQAVGTLVGAKGFQLLSADFKNEIALVRLLACMQLVRRLGVSPVQLFDWATTASDVKQSNDITQTVKAKYDDETWLTIGKALNDSLREKQRNALVAYAMTEPDIIGNGITSTDQLFEYFLIDVEMSACMMTSRIKQAISSVQLFVQMCLMNLVPDVKPSLIDEDQWKWMKNYRVWEANRKVFLYPENWIEPELRDAKSPFFAELESQLLQNDITQDTAEQALLDYLEKLDEVARLEVCGVCHQYEQVDDNTTIDILHVFGRTLNTPPIYYYRQLVDRTTWTAWEKVTLDIQGDHLIPVIYNHRLYLFWPTFEEKSDKDQSMGGALIESNEHWEWRKKHEAWKKSDRKWQQNNAVYQSLKSFDEQSHLHLADLWIQTAPFDPEGEPKEPSQPESIQPSLTHWEIKLNWSEYWQKKWTTKQVSTQSVRSPNVTKTFDSVLREAWPGDKYLQDFFMAYLSNPADAVSTYLQNPAGHIISPSRKTVAELYLPEQQYHFFRMMVDDAGELVVKVYRRYQHEFQLPYAWQDILPFLGSHHRGIFIASEIDQSLNRSTRMQEYDDVGEFRLTGCGSKVKAMSHVQKKKYDSIKEPDGTDNSFMDFAYDGNSPRHLQFTADGKSLEVLKAINESSGQYDLLNAPDHSFALKAPFQRFFYQDRQRAYYVHPRTLHAHQSLTDAESVFPSLSVAAVDDPLVGKIKSSAISTEAVAPTAGTGQPIASHTFMTNSVDEIATGQFSDNMMTSGSLAELGLACQDGLSTLEKDPVFDLAGLSPTYLEFENFFHPHVCAFIKALNQKGISGLMARGDQERDHDEHPSPNQQQIETVFDQQYKPTPIVYSDYPREDVDFSDGAYALYNWELFFHIPMLIATQLSQNQQFEDAQEWFHYIFNPTTTSKNAGPQRYWNTLPFFLNSHPENDQIQMLLSALDSNDEDTRPSKEDVAKQIKAWRDDPFNPYHIARMRIIAFQKNVVMKYVDNLIAWGDQLFSQDTIETINEATLLYVLAYNILGPRPEVIPPKETPEPLTYHQLRGHLDEFSNALVGAENEVAIGFSQLSPAIVCAGISVKGNSGAQSLKSVAGQFYFCIPDNDSMLQYWDTVGDRLFKIRNCMNIEGVVRELPLFEPPIDPMLLVRAKAMGLDLSSVLSDINSPQPHYRFSYMVQKAQELCSEVKALGGALLSALEKKDAEALSALRATQETTLLKAVRDVKQRQIDEANAALDGLRKSKEAINERHNFYKEIEFLNAEEAGHLALAVLASGFQVAGQALEISAAGEYIEPDEFLGAAGFSSPVEVLKFGGSNLGDSTRGYGQAMGVMATFTNTLATLAATMGGYQRRWDEWRLQERVSAKELDQLDKQIAAAEIRVAIAEKDLQNHDKQLENAAAIEDFLRSKYTNEELYNWMTSQISSVFFQSYKLAYDTAKRAEKAYRFERGLTSSSFIQFGYWDNLRKGLLSGERLHLDLKRLEMAHLDQNRREYEISKNISLVMFDPLALIALKETGQCEISLPEELFDVDYPGHYMRRIKSVSLTIPCVVGPYTSLNCTLTLLSNKTRINGNAQGDYPEQDDDSRFVNNFVAMQSIATSHAQNDSGMFDLNFRDERYLPFEGAGVISRWRVDMPKYCNAFDFETISDVILKLSYMARDGGDVLRQKARTAVLPAASRQKVVGDNFVPPPQENLLRLFSAKHEFPSDWYRFLHPDDEAAPGQTLQLVLTPDRFPFQFRGRAIQISRADLFLKLSDTVRLQSGKTYAEAYSDGKELTVQLNPPSADHSIAGELVQDKSYANLPHAKIPSDDQAAGPWPIGTQNIWRLEVREDDIKQIAGDLQVTITVNGQSHQRLKADAIEDLWIVFTYSALAR
jgi:hypothetical protein